MSVSRSSATSMVEHVELVAEVDSGSAPWHHLVPFLLYNRLPKLHCITHLGSTDQITETTQRTRRFPPLCKFESIVKLRFMGSNYSKFADFSYVAAALRVDELHFEQAAWNLWPESELRNQTSKPISPHPRVRLVDIKSSSGDIWAVLWLFCYTRRRKCRSILATLCQDEVPELGEVADILLRRNSDWFGSTSFQRTEGESLFNRLIISICAYSPIQFRYPSSVPNSRSRQLNSANMQAV